MAQELWGRSWENGLKEFSNLTYLDHSNLLLQLEYVLYIKIHIE